MSNLSLSACLVSRSAKGRASHGISAKYDWKAGSSWSEDTNTISKDLPIATMLVYDEASSSVYPRHGGHLVRCIVRAPRQSHMFRLFESLVLRTIFLQAHV